MEENDHHNGERRDSGEESNRAILPLLQAPGNQQPHRITNFYIDNILRPDFGRRKDRTFNYDENNGRENIARVVPKTGVIVAGEGTSNSRSVGEPKKDDIVADAPLKPRGETGDQCLSSDSDSSQASSAPLSKPMLWPAWVYCTRYSDRPSAGPRSRKPKKTTTTTTTTATTAATTTTATPSKDDKRPRTAFTAEQLQRLKTEFQTNRYLTEQRRQSLAQELGLNESQIKIWFQNKRAKIKKATGNKNALALHLMAQGLYNHATTSKDEKSEDSD